MLMNLSRGRWSVFMLEYNMEELLPIVARLTDKYTSKESSSIPFETAKQLMEAVIYCINHAELMDDNTVHRLEEVGLIKPEQLSAEEAYECGYHILVEKVKRLNVKYSSLLSYFSSYRNQAYYDTIVKGMPAFFLYYDVKFAPQNHILTLDYPTLRFIGDVQGVDAIERYLNYTEYEQTFLKAFPEEYILKALELYHTDYEELLINVCSIVLRNVLVCMWIDKPISGNRFTKNEINYIREKILEKGQPGIDEIIMNLLQSLIRWGYEDNKELLEYLSYDIHEFSAELWNAAQHNSVNILLGGEKA